jgi:hypothetical protein
MTTVILDLRPATPPDIHHANDRTHDFVRLFALERSPKAWRPLICHWYRDAAGRLACIWEPDIPPVAQALIVTALKDVWRTGENGCLRPNFARGARL